MFFHIMSCYYYLDVLFIIESAEKSAQESVDIYKLKQIIIHCIKTLFGEAGAANQVDILKYEKEKGRAILRCFSDFYVKLRASLSFGNQFNNILFSFHITKASPSLLSLQANNLSYEF